ncbi:MAG TPA: hypothetical protein VG184_01850 [Acidimicrobiales bacterium]|nr:hypothetical protein [Acidimicrobiales bacterium]
MGATAGLMAWAGVAFACTSSILMQVTPASLLAGATATVRGQGFEPPSQGSAVTINLDTANGQTVEPLPTVEPDAAGNFTLSFTVPKDAPGYYLAIAYQNDLVTGQRTNFTPVRAEMQIAAPPRSPSTPAPAPGNSSTPAPSPTQAPVTVAPVTHTQPVAASPVAQQAPVTQRAPAAQQAPAAQPAAAQVPATPTRAATSSAPVRVTPAQIAPTQQPGSRPSPSTAAHARQPAGSSAAAPTAVGSSPPHASYSSTWWLLGPLALAALAALGMAGGTFARSPARRARRAKTHR